MAPCAPRAPRALLRASRRARRVRRPRALLRASCCARRVCRPRGRGSSRCCRSRSGGRGSLLACGDVHPQPGPQTFGLFVCRSPPVSWLVASLLAAAADSLSTRYHEACLVLGPRVFASSVSLLRSAPCAAALQVVSFWGGALDPACVPVALALLPSEVASSLLSLPAPEIPARPPSAYLPLGSPVVVPGWAEVFAVASFSPGFCSLLGADGSTIFPVPVFSVVAAPTTNSVAPPSLPAPLPPEVVLPPRPLPLPFPPGPGGLRVLSWNVRSLRRRLGAVLALAGSFPQPDVLLLQEVRDVDVETLALLSARFSVFSALRPDRRGGGVVVLVRAGLCAAEQISFPSPDGANEACLVRLGLPAGPLVVASVYVSPTCRPDANGALNQFLLSLGSAGASLVGGDLNAHSALWDPSPPPSDPQSVALGRQAVDACVALGWQVANAKSPAATHDLGRALDVVFACGSLPVSSFAVLGCTFGSDHSPVCVSFGVAVVASFSPPRVAWRKVTAEHWRTFSASLASVPVGALLRGSVSRRAAALNSLVLSGLSSFPRSGRRRTLLPADVLALCSRCRQLWAAKGFGSPELHSATQELRALLLAASPFAAASSSPWRAFRETAVHAPWLPLSSADGVPLFSASAQASAFAACFAAKHAPDPPPGAVGPLPASAVVPFALGCLREALASMRHDGAPDPSGVPPQVLPHLPDSFLVALLALANDTLRSGRLPAQWLRSLLVPVPKPRAPPSALSSFRPVALTALFCRVVEVMVLRRLRLLVSLSPWQLGFVPGLPAAPLLLAHTVGDLSVAQATRVRGPNSGASWRKDSRPVRSLRSLLVLLDLQDAFCRPAPAVVCLALAELGVPGYLVSWVLAFLSSRSFSVRWRSVLSPRVCASRGFPQGSVLGPFLWSVVADRLAVSLSTRWRAIVVERGLSGSRGLLADDLSFWLSGPSPAPLVAAARLLVGVVVSWASALDITVSSKSCALVVGSPAAAAEFAALPSGGDLAAAGLGFALLPGGSPVRHLGLRVDAALSFASHVEALIDSLAPLLARLQLLSRRVAPSALHQLYWGVGLSRLLFAAPLWFPCLPVAARERLSALHAAFARAVSGTHRTTRVAASLAEAHLLPLDAYVARSGFRLAAGFLSLPRSFPAVAAVCAVPRDTNGFFSSFVAPVAVVVGSSSLLPSAPPRSPLVPLPEWQSAVSFSLLPAGVSRLSPAPQRAAHNRKIFSRAVAATLVSDGGIGPSFGVGAAVLVGGSPPAVKQLSSLAVWHPCSLSAEAAAFLAAVELLAALLPSLPPAPTVLLATDSLSLLSSLAVGPWRASPLCAPIWAALLPLLPALHTLRLAFVFGHCECPWQSLADSSASALLHSQPASFRPLWAVDAARVAFSPVRAAAVASLRAGAPLRSALVPPLADGSPGPVFLRWASSLSVARQRLLAQLRAGVCGGLGGVRHSTPEPCPLCFAPGVLCRSGGAVRHLFSCPAFPPPEGVSAACLGRAEGLEAVVAFVLAFLARCRGVVA